MTDACQHKHDVPAADVTVIIPARLDAQRLPNKPLALIGDKPMLLHSYQQAVAAFGQASVFAAVDDPRLKDLVEGAGGQAVLTEKTVQSGTDRVAQAAAILGLADDAIILNLQGDEPFMPSVLLQELAAMMRANPEAEMGTLATALREPALFASPSVVKLVCDAQGRALYFSRAPIPYARAEQGALPEAVARGALAGYWRHIGLYAYRFKSLRRFASLPQSFLEKMEMLEQLRALEAGFHIQVGTASCVPPLGVDTPEDLDRARAFWAAQHKG